MQINVLPICVNDIRCRSMEFLSFATKKITKNKHHCFGNLLQFDFYINSFIRSRIHHQTNFSVHDYPNPDTQQHQHIPHQLQDHESSNTTKCLMHKLKRKLSLRLFFNNKSTWIHQIINSFKWNLSLKA